MSQRSNPNRQRGASSSRDSSSKTVAASGATPASPGAGSRHGGSTAGTSTRPSDRPRRYREPVAASKPLRERRGLLMILGSAIVIVALAGLGLLSAYVRGGTSSTPPPNVAGVAAWPAAPADSTLQERLGGAGLQVLTTEGEVLHIHDHVDITVNGRTVTVPADVGIDQSAGILSPIHTHDTSGVIHVESPVVRDFTLGEFFWVWGVTLTQSCIGDFCTGSNVALKMWVNGQPYSGNPADLKLAAHQEIVIAYGTPDQMPGQVPATYSWNGL